SGLSANSTTFTLQRNADAQYWNGSAWQASAANLATTHGATTGGTSVTWNSSATMPTWASENDGTYTIQATATDKSVSSFSGAAVVFTLDKTPSTVASVTAPIDGTIYTAATLPATFSGSA